MKWKKKKKRKKNETVLQVSKDPKVIMMGSFDWSPYCEIISQVLGMINCYGDWILYFLIMRGIIISWLSPNSGEKPLHWQHAKVEERNLGAAGACLLSKLGWGLLASISGYQWLVCPEEILKEPLGLPPDKEMGFCIDSVPGAWLVSIEPYCMLSTNWPSWTTRWTYCWIRVCQN